MEPLPLPQTKQSKWHNSTRGLAKQPRRRSPWTSRKRLYFLNSLQGPGCLAKSALSCLVWLASGYQKKIGWLLAGFWLASGWTRTYLAETGWTSPLPGDGLVEALPLPQTKQSKWHKIPRVGLRSSPGVDRVGRPEKGCTSLAPCKTQAHKRSKVNGTIPRVGLRSSPGVDRLGRPEKGCTSLTLCKAQAALPNQPSLAWFGWLLALKKRGLVGFWLAFGWLKKNLVLTWLKLAGPPRCRGRPCGGTAPPTNEAKQMAQFHAWACEAAQASIVLDVRKRLHFLNSLQGPGCLAKSALSCLVWLASGYQKKRFGWLLAGFWLASGWLSGWTSPCLEKYCAYLAETGWTSPLPGGGLVEAHEAK